MYTLSLHDALPIYDGAYEEKLHRLHVEVLDHERNRIGAHAEIRRMAEGKQPRVAEEEVEAETGDGEDQPVRELDGPVRIHHPREHGQKRRDRHRPDHDPERRPRRRGAESDGAHVARPKRPAGRTNKTIAAIR